MTVKNNSPRLLVLTSTFPRWKNDTDPPFVYELSKRLTGAFDVTVHVPHYPGAEPNEIVDGMKVHRFRYFFEPLEKLAGSTGILPTLRHNKLFYGMVPFFLIAQFCSVLILVRKIRPDIIHAHWIIPQGFIAVFAQILFGVPVVATAHGADIFGLQGPMFRVIKRFSLKRFRAVTVVSRALADALVGLIPPDTQPEIISMGVDSILFSADKTDDLIRGRYAVKGPFLLYVGRLTEKKGVRYLIDAMPQVLKEFPSSKLIIIGSGELEEALKVQATSLELTNSIHFTGSVPNSELPEYYATSDIFIGPSIQTEGGDTEGFGLTFVEAAMCGCLVIGTRTGGIGDIIQDNVTGMLVPEKNTEALAEKIIYALEHEKEVEEIKKNSKRQSVDRYDWSVIVKHYEEIFVNTLTYSETMSPNS